MKTIKTKTTKTKIVKATATKMTQTHSPIYVTKILHAKAKKLAKEDGMTLSAWANKNIQRAIKN